LTQLARTCEAVVAERAFEGSIYMAAPSSIVDPRGAQRSSIGRIDVETTTATTEQPHGPNVILRHRPLAHRARQRPRAPPTDTTSAPVAEPPRPHFDTAPGRSRSRPRHAWLRTSHSRTSSRAR